MTYNAWTVSGEEVGQLETLEGQWRAALDKHKVKKRHVKQLEEDLQVMYFFCLVMHYQYYVNFFNIDVSVHRLWEGPCHH